MNVSKLWYPPGKNCGLCGVENCKEFLQAVRVNSKEYSDCPYYEEQQVKERGLTGACYQPTDILGHEYDFILAPLPGEISARKFVLPFRSDLVEKFEIQTGDLVMGRPMGAGPRPTVPHQRTSCLDDPPERLRGQRRVRLVGHTKWKRRLRRGRLLRRRADLVLGLPRV